MESTARNIRYLEPPSLAEQVKARMAAEGKNVEGMAKEIGIARPTLSRYLSGSYTSDPKNVEAKIAAYLGGEAPEQPHGEAVTPRPERPGFFETQDAKSIIGVCRSCQEYTGLGLVVGRSGYGKTHTLRHYAKLPRVAYLECDDTMSCRDLVDEIERLLGIPGGVGSNRRRVNGIRNLFNANPGYLLIVDEADKLINKNTQKKMEILRGIFDRSRMGLVIAGEPCLEARIKTLLPRMANRMDFYWKLQGLTASEVEGYFKGFEVEREALDELMHRACDPQNGCFRLLDRTIKNVFRLLDQHEEQRITLKRIQQASSMMML